MKKLESIKGPNGRDEKKMEKRIGINKKKSGRRMGYQNSYSPYKT